MYPKMSTFPSEVRSTETSREGAYVPYGRNGRHCG